MSGQHTPGPWALDQDAQISSVSAVGTDNEYIGIAYMTLPNHEANARLIAAAPDLLEALRLFVDEYTELVNSGDAGNWDPEEEHKVIVARAAIAKATGAA